MHWLVVATFMMVALSGCVAAPDVPQNEPDEPVQTAVTPRPTVVAVIDSGVNVYHDQYRRSESLPAPALATFVNTLDDQAPANISLTLEGDYDARLEADEDVWANMTEHALYYFEGTNVLGISFDDDDDHPVLDDGSHGTGTTSAVFDVDPDTIVVLVEGFGPDAEAWAARQPWIDIVSMSYGPIGSVPTTGTMFGLNTSEATRAMWAAGQIPVGAVDNTPALATFDETAGPPWVVGVAGDHPDGCRESISGNFPDFTSDFTQQLPTADSTDENRSMSGTSFATPKTAGSFALALRTLRDTYGAPPAATAQGVLVHGPDGTDLTNQDLRAAFERAASYFEASPTCLEGTVNPVAPWAQQGWGHVGPEMVDDAVAVITGSHEVPDKPQGAKDWNGRHMALRETYWGRA